MKIEQDDEIRIADYYDRLVKQYGHDPRACDASNQNSLEIRYRVLSEVMDLSGRSVLEAGCGFGDLGIYLQKKYSNVHYYGIDISKRMIEGGLTIHPHLSLSHQNLLDMGQDKRFDVVLAQGVFYLLGEGAEEKMFRLIQKMFS